MASGTHWEEDNEWELINDDGFVYKRRKRRRFDPNSTSEQPPPDSPVEEKKSHERKKRALLKLKTSYQREICQWEHLSSTLNDMKQKNPREINDLKSSTYQVTAPPFPLEQSSGANCRQLVDELLSQAEAQSDIIRDVSNLCDVAEALCSAKEESFKQIFAELPIWALSPRKLITSLCDSI